MTGRSVAAALRAGGFKAHSYDSGVALVPCTTGECVEAVWTQGRQTFVPKGPHAHKKQVRPRSAVAGFDTYEYPYGVVVVGVDHELAADCLAAAGYDVQLTEHEWASVYPQARWSSLIVLGKKEVTK